MKIIVILNKASLEQLKIDENILQNAFKSENIDARIYLADGAKIPELVTNALAKNIDAVIAGGGDGTVSSVARILAGGKIPLGVLPLGTLNHFAKDIGMSLNYQEAIRQIAGGKIREIDVGEVNGHIFINNSSIGLYPIIVKNRDKQKEEHGINKWAAMFISSFKVLTHFPTFKVFLEADNEKVNCKTPFVFIGNNEYIMDLFTPVLRPDLTEGKLSLYMSCCTNKLSIFRFALLFVLNKIDQAKDFNHMKVDEVCIEIKKKRIEVSADGEIIYLNPPLNYKIIPKYLSVIIPLNPANN